MPGTVPKDLRSVVKAVRAKGWSVAPSKGNSCHLHFRDPSGVLRVVVSATPGDGGVKRIVLGQLRRCGLEI